EQAAKERGVKPDGKFTTIGSLLKSDNHLLLAAAARLVGAWKLEEYRGTLAKTAKVAAETAISDVLFEAVLDGLVGLGGKESANAFDELVMSKDTSTTKRRKALVALAS